MGDQLIPLTQPIAIGQITIAVLGTYVAAVQAALAAERRVDTQPTPAGARALVIAWEHVLSLPKLAEHAELAAIARAQLAMALYRCLTLRHDAGELLRAIGLLQRALGVNVALLAAERPRWQNALSLALRKRFEHENNLADLKQSIALAQTALQNAPPASIYRERIHNTLALGLLLRYDRLGAAGDLGQAIASLQAAIQACAPQSREWGMRKVNLSAALIRRYELHGSIAAIDQAIDELQQAEQAIRPGDLNWGALQSQRAMALLRRFGALGQIADLHAATASAQAAIAAAPAGYPQLAALQNNLALALETRFMALGAAPDLDAAIEVYRSSLQAASAQLWNRVHFHVNLSSALVRRFSLLRRAGDIDEAIQLLQAALTAVPAQGPERATMLNNLSVAFSERHKVQRRPADLAAATAAAQHALEATPPNTADWASRQSNMGSLLHEQFKHTQQPGTLERAIAAHAQALALAQPNTYDWALYNAQLSCALYSRYELARRPADFQALFEACQKARSVFNAERWPEHALLAAQNLGAAYALRADWQRASEVLLTGMQIITTVYQRQLLAIERESWLTRAINTYRRAAYTLARAGRLQDAVAALEQGRARSLAEALGMADAETERLRAAAPQVFDTYTQAAARFRALRANEHGMRASQPSQASQGDLRPRLHAAQAEVDAALARIRRIPGFERYLAEPNFDDIASAVQPGTSLVYLDLAAEGAFALVVHRAADWDVRIAPVWMPGATIARIQALVLNHEQHGQVGSYLRGLAGEQPATEHIYLTEALTELLPSLGEHLLAPLATLLRQLQVSKVVLSPGFMLPLLPLHAARYQVGGQAVTFMDEFEVTYTPSARALAGAQRQARASARSIIAVGQPQRAGLAPAPLTEWLAQSACRQLRGGQALSHQAASAQGLRQVLREGSPQHLLLACHGWFDLGEPLRSHLALADGALTLAQVCAELPLTATALVTLCSCRTAIRDFVRAPDEAIGFPAGFLRAGAQAVIAPLWSVEPLPTVLLLWRLYQQIGKGLAPSAALRHATRWLRTLDEAQFRALTRARLDGEMDPLTAVTLDLHASRYSGPYPFAAPAHWAAFTYTGASLQATYSDFHNS